MKIAIVSDVFYPYLMGGAERRYWELARRMAVNNEVHVFTMRWYSYPKKEEIDGITIHRKNTPSRLYSGRRRSIYESLTFSANLFLPFLKNRGFDVIDANQFPFFPLFPTKILSKRCDCPMVVTWHEVWAEYWYTYMDSRAAAYLGEKIEAYSVKLPDQIVAVSHKTRESLMGKFRIPGNKISVVPNGIDCKFIDSVNADKVDNKILFVGRLLPHKKVDALIGIMPSILREVKDARLTIVGDGPMKKELIHLSKKLGIEGCVEFLGMLNYEEVIKQMKSSSLFVLPSIREGFGIVLVEAMAAKTPVIAINAEQSGASEIINEKNGILCESKDLLETVLEVLLNQELRNKLAKNGYAYSRAFDWDARAEETLHVYERVMEKT